jgi:hypothetical protein
MARVNEHRVSWHFIGTVFLVFLLGNYYQLLWLFSSVSVLVLMLVVLQVSIPLMKRHPFLISILIYLGGTSMHLFFVHGFLRRPFLYVAHEYENWFITLIMAIAFTMVAVAVAQLAAWAEQLAKKRALALYN